MCTMNSVFWMNSYLPLPMTPLLHQLRPNLHLQPTRIFFNQQNCNGGQSSSFFARFQSICPYSMRNLLSTVRVATPEDEGAVSVMNFEELMEKDWSFLEFVDKSFELQHKQKTDQVISAGEIRETSKVLISIGSEEFVHRVVNDSPSELVLVVHDSLLTLACIKEKYDNVKCWHGELIYLPEKWAQLDVVFLYYLPALHFQLSQILETLAKHCSPGARIVISHLQGRQMLQEQQKHHPDIVVAELPDKRTLQHVAVDKSFELVKFVDEPDFYLAVLKFKGNVLV